MWNGQSWPSSYGVSACHQLFLHTEHSLQTVITSVFPSVVEETFAWQGVQLPRHLVAYVSYQICTCDRISSFTMHLCPPYPLNPRSHHQHSETLHNIAPRTTPSPQKLPSACLSLHVHGIQLIYATGSRSKLWATFNEPGVFAMCSYVAANHPPGMLMQFKVTNFYGGQRS